MAIRHIIFAAFMASACAAHADVIPAGSNGASVLGAGVLSGNLGLIGGAAYGTGVTQPGTAVGGAGQAALFSSNGLEGMYLLGSGHGILAAMFGSGFSTAGSTGAGAGMTGGAGGIAVTGMGMGGAAGGAPGALGAAAAASGSVGIATAVSHGAMGVQVAAPRAAAAVPEPSTTALMLIGMIGAGALTRRRPR